VAIFFGTAQTSRGFAHMSEKKYLEEAPILERIGKILNETLNDVRREPVPERWVDLIHRLDAEEDDSSGRDFGSAHRHR
jgi:uncharacterized protein YifE (UPF0438 family)